jgi:hypothetical protein
MIHSNKIKTVQIAILSARRTARAFGLPVPSAVLLAATCVLAIGMVGCMLPTNGTDPTVDSTATPGAPMPQDSDYVEMPKGPNGWSANGTLLSANYTKTVNLQAQFNEPGDYTAEFSFSPTKLADGSNQQAEALVTWAVEGNFVSRRVAISNGASITGVAQAVRIVIFDTTNASAPRDIGVLYGVSVQVTRGQRATTMQPPTLTPHPFFDDEAIPPVIRPYAQAQYTITPEGGGGAGNGDGFIVLPIPQDAGIISLFVTVSNTTAVAPYQAQGTAPVIPNDTVQVEVDNGANFQVYDPRVFPGWVPLLPGAQRIILRNNMPAGQPVVLFTVTLGIDG